MIISHKHKYLFIEIPLTASWAIRYELCNYYGGSPILHKHATYPEFLQAYGEEVDDYFIFAAVRNPLDEIVSRYYKLKTNHKGVFSNQKSAQELVSDYSDFEKYQYIKDSNAEFADYFRKYYKRPFGGLIDIASVKYDFVIRFENLQSDFSRVLNLLNIPQVRPVPFENRTKGRRADWESYYSPEIRKQAQIVCGPFMKKWGYEFPPDWLKYQVDWTNQIEYHLVSVLRNIYFTNFRYKNNNIARFVRQLRARFL